MSKMCVNCKHCHLEITDQNSKGTIYEVCSYCDRSHLFVNPMNECCLEGAPFEQRETAITAEEEAVVEFLVKTNMYTNIADVK